MNYAGEFDAVTMRASSRASAIACRTAEFDAFAGSVEEHVVTHSDVHVPVRLWRPHGIETSHVALVWFHGGGWVIGSNDNVEQAARTICDAAACIVLSVDYRLGPPPRRHH